jgi:hypothetical protein
MIERNVRSSTLSPRVPAFGITKASARSAAGRASPEDSPAP